MRITSHEALEPKVHEGAFGPRVPNRGIKKHSQRRPRRKPGVFSQSSEWDIMKENAGPEAGRGRPERRRTECTRIMKEET